MVMVSNIREPATKNASSPNLYSSFPVIPRTACSNGDADASFPLPSDSSSYALPAACSGVQIRRRVGERLKDDVGGLKMSCSKSADISIGRRRILWNGILRLRLPYPPRRRRQDYPPPLCIEDEMRFLWERRTDESTLEKHQAKSKANF